MLELSAETGTVSALGGVISVLSEDKDVFSRTFELTAPRCDCSIDAGVLMLYSLFLYV